MSICQKLYCVLSIAALAVLGSGDALAQKDTDVVAEVGGVKLTRADLQRAEAAKLLQARYQYYQAESKALDDLIEKELLEQKAKSENLTVEQLVARDINAQVKDPTEDQMKVYYEGLETDQPYEAVREKILEKIRQVRTDKARIAYLKGLRAQSSVYIALAGPTADVNVENANWLGAKSAPVLLVEFADYECPYCQRVAPDIQKLVDEFGAKIAFAYKDFPLPMHPRAEKAAEAARCAGKQGKFWQFHDQLFRSKELNVDQLKAQARVLGLDSSGFDKCLDSGEESAVVAQDRAEGVGLGLSGTPSFFINGHYFSGAVDYTALHQLVDQQLSVPTHVAAMTALR
jgi:protein-disulfide isomerase